VIRDDLKAAIYIPCEENHDEHSLDVAQLGEGVGDLLRQAPRGATKGGIDAFWCTKPVTTSDQHGSSLEFTACFTHCLGRPESVQRARSTLRSLKASENNKVWSCDIKMPLCFGCQNFYDPIVTLQVPWRHRKEPNFYGILGWRESQDSQAPWMCESKHRNRCSLILLPSRSIASWRMCRKDLRP